jgi:hypothetical protein
VNAKRGPTLFDNRPRIVADFEYQGAEWLVVDWPGDEDSDKDGEWQVYRADLPWTWRADAVDVR